MWQTPYTPGQGKLKDNFISKYFRSYGNYECKNFSNKLWLKSQKMQTEEHESKNWKNSKNSNSQISELNLCHLSCTE